MQSALRDWGRRPRPRHSRHRRRSSRRRLPQRHGHSRPTQRGMGAPRPRSISGSRSEFGPGSSGP
eukprot:7834024-Pyramimonas_sp.AAC.1